MKKYKWRDYRKITEYVKFLNSWRNEIILLIANIFYIYFFTTLSIRYHENFMTYAWDLGIFAQSFESFIRYGWLFYNNVELPYNPSGSFFGIHFSPIMFLVVPFYFLYPGVETLFFIQSIVLSLPSIIVYKICEKEFESKLLSLLIALSYLFYLPLHGVNTFDFHVQSFIPLFYSLCFYYYRKYRFGLSYISAILILSCIEFSPFLVASLGIYIFLKEFRSKYKWYGLILLFTSILWYFLAKNIIEYLNPMQISFEQYYILYNIDLSTSFPKLLLKRIFIPAKIEYIKLIFSPHLFLELLAPIELLLLTGPWFAIVLLTNIPMYFSPYFQYISFIVFQIYLTLIYGLKNFNKALSHIYRSKKLTYYLSILVTILTVITSILLGPLGLCKLDNTTIFKKSHSFAIKTYMNFRIKALENVLKFIPENATILLPNGVFPHLYKNFRAYSSLIPGKTGYPLLLEKIVLRNISSLYIGSKNDSMYFHGYIYNISLIIDGNLQKMYQKTINHFFENNFTILNLGKRFQRINELSFSILLKPFPVNTSESIVFCNAFMIGLSQELAPAITIFPENMNSISYIVPFKLTPYKLYCLTLYINSTHTMLYINRYCLFTQQIGEKLVGWIVDNVDYVLLDTVSAYWNFRIGICPIIIPKKYGLYAAGDGVMLFKRNHRGPVISLSQGNYTIEFYDNMVPRNKPVLIMNMSRIEWKKWFWPIIPYAYKYNITRIEYNVSIKGVLSYSFVNPAPKVFYTNNIVNKYSAIIRGPIKIDEKGVYSINVKTAYPSTTKVYINGKRVEDKVYLNAGYHELKIIWNNIVISYLKLKLKKL